MNKLIHGANVSGQSIVDRALAAKHTVAGQSLAKVICKATTEEVMGPKRKHLDYLLHCTNEQNVSIPSMANLLIERTQNTNWVVVFKALVTVHNLMNYGNERFMQCLASNNCTFNLSGFTDKSGTQGYDMSTYIRRYSKYLNEKAFSYRQMAFDFCKVKRGKEDGLLRTMNADKLLKTLPVLQAQLDALVEFDVTPNELTNGVINTAFMLLFKDLIRLFACYNDGIINLLEKYFDVNKKQCREALDVYKKFLARMDRVCEFLKVAESVGIDKGDIPDLAKAPSSLLEALEQHLASLENSKKTGSTVLPKPAAGVSAVISSYAAASQVGTAPGAGSDVAHITEEERQRILEEEQRQLDQMKQQKLKQVTRGSSPVGTGAATASSASSSRPVTTSAANNASPSNSTNHSDFSSGGNPPSNRHNEDLFALSAPLSFSQPATSNLADNSTFLGSGSNPFGEVQVTATPLMVGGGGISGPVATTGAWGSPVFAGSVKTAPHSQALANQFATDANFAAVFGAGNVGAMPTSSTQQPASAFDGYGEILKPTNTGSASQGQSGTPINKQDKLIRADLDSSLASLAGGLNIKPAGQVKKTDHQWTTSVGEKKLTGGGPIASSGWNQPMAPAGPPAWNQAPIMASSSYQMVQPMPVLVGMPAGGMSVGVMPVGSMAVGGMPMSGMTMTGQAPMVAAYPTSMVQPRPAAMNQPAPGAWAPIQPQPFVAQRPSHQLNAPNDPFGAL